MKEFSDSENVVGKHEDYHNLHDTYYGPITDEEGVVHRYIVMQYIKGKVLKDLLSVRHSGFYVVEYEYALYYIHQIITGIKDIHDKGWAHRDIKLENIMLEDNTDRCIIIDLGFAVNVDNPVDGYTCKKVKGTWHYAAPELVNPEKINSEKSFNCQKADIFAAGVCLYYMLYGSSPFRRRKNGGITNNDIGDDDIIVPKYDQSSKWTDEDNVKIKDLIKKMLNVDMDKRPDAEECLKILPARGGGISNLNNRKKSKRRKRKSKSKRRKSKRRSKRRSKKR